MHSRDEMAVALTKYEQGPSRGFGNRRRGYTVSKTQNCLSLGSTPC